MALTKYTPSANKIVHVTGVDFSSRPTTFTPVHLVQYDKSMPIVEVKLYNNGVKYAVPSTADANIRFGKHGTFVNNKVLGVNDDRTSIYFEVSLQMVTQYGKFNPVIELTVGTETAASSPIMVIVDKNPIQNSDIEDQTEFKTLESYVDDAKKSATEANGYRDSAATSASQASSSASSAASSASSATQSKTEAAQSAADALSSKNAAAQSASEALESKTSAAQSASSAAADAESTASDRTVVASDKKEVTEMTETVTTKAEEVSSNAEKAATSEANAKSYSESAEESKTAAGQSATEAEASNVSAGEHSANAKSYADAAKTSQTEVEGHIKDAQDLLTTTQTKMTENLEASEQYKTDAETAANNAKASETLVAGYSESAERSAADAKSYADAAKTSQTEVESHLEEATNLVSEAQASVDEAKSAATSASGSADAAAESLKKVQEYETNGEQWATKAQSYAVGGTSSREGEDTENSKYLYEQTKAIADSLTSALKPMGNITFQELIDISEPVEGQLYNITNEDGFTSTEAFTDGGGQHYPKGSDVFYTSEGKWNVLQGSGVSGVKGEAESTYRKGQVEIRKEHLGLENVNNTADSEKEVALAEKVRNALTVNRGEESYNYDGSAETVIDIPTNAEILDDLTAAQVEKALGYNPSSNRSWDVCYVTLTPSEASPLGVYEKDIFGGRGFKWVLQNELFTENRICLISLTDTLGDKVREFYQKHKFYVGSIGNGSLEIQASTDCSDAPGSELELTVMLGPESKEESSDTAHLIPPSGITKNMVTNALGYIPPVEDTQGINLIDSVTSKSDVQADSMTIVSKEDVSDESVPSKKALKITLNKTAEATAPDLKIISSIDDYEEGARYTLSFYAKNEGHVLITRRRNLVDDNAIDEDNYVNINSTWQKFVFAFTYTNKTSAFTMHFDFSSSMNNWTDNVLYLSSLKIERGNIENPVWTPKPSEMMQKTDFTKESIIETLGYRPSGPWHFTKITLSEDTAIAIDPMDLVVADGYNYQWTFNIPEYKMSKLCLLVPIINEKDENKEFYQQHKFGIHESSGSSFTIISDTNCSEMAVTFDVFISSEDAETFGKTIIIPPSGITKNMVTNALGYEPPVNDTQGVNLLTGTKDFSGDWNRSYSWNKEEETYNELTVYSRSSEYSGAYQDYYVEAGKTYTFSLFAKADVNTTANIYVSSVMDNPEADRSDLTPWYSSNVITTEWKRYVLSFKCTKSGICDPRLELTATGSTKLYICGYKLERGTVSDTVWTPAPEDVVTKSELGGFKSIYGSTIRIPGNNNITNMRLSTGLYLLNYCQFGSWPQYGMILINLRNPSVGVMAIDTHVIGGIEADTTLKIIVNDSNDGITITNTILATLDATLYKIVDYHLI